MEKRKNRIILLVIALAVLLGLGGIAGFGYAKPYLDAANSMNDGLVELAYQTDGGILVTWPEGNNAEGYQLRVLQPGTAAEGDTAETAPAAEEIFTTVVEETQCVLTDIPLDRTLEIRIESYCDYRFLFSGETRRRVGEDALSISGRFAPPAISDLTWEADENTDVLTVDFTLPQNGVCRVYHGTGGDLEQIDSLTTGHAAIAFGADALQVPDRGQQHIFTFDVVCTYADYVYTGIRTGEIVITREDLLGTDLNAQWVDEGENVYSVTWSETKGAYYAVQQFDEASDTWTQIHVVEPDDERAYSTGHLPPYSEFTYRVVAVGGETLPDSEYAAISENYCISTGASVVYSTVWPIQDLTFYSDPQKSGTIGTVPAGQACCVLAVEGDLFRVRYADDYGYIDSRYCMINLPEMIGDLCSYHITNSYSSLYMVHEYDMPDVTGQVVTGYENIRQSGGEYLVPLLYPVALKLEDAAFAAREAGYRLKIYDSFRPQKATRFLYDLASGILDDPVPGQEQVGTAETTPAGETVPAPALVTYRSVMTDDGRYSLNYFLARGGSRHNQGIALDLTLETLSGRKELQMQTAMHDLSWYSENNENNANANKLRSIMLGAGFTGLVSEWWHFQDNDAKDELEPAYLWNGVSAACWMADDHGWRYRTASGKYVAGTSRTIDGVEYTFDENGYVLQPQDETDQVPSGA